MKHLPTIHLPTRRSTRHHSLLLVLCAAITASVVSTSRLAAQEPVPQPNTSTADARLLLLKNGNLLSGRITRQGDYYHVAHDGGRLRIRAAEVVAPCRDVAEAYRLRRQSIQPTVVYDYLELANWCIRHHLYEQAADELERAEQADPGHPRLALLRKRLELAQQPVTTPQRPSVKPRTGPTVDELEKMVRSMPSGTVEYFASRIQPLLVNSCATSACHGPDAPNRFRLTRIPSHRPPGRRVTQRNLFSTLQWVDHRHPGKSPLLTVPTQPHGPTRIVLFPDPTTRRYQQLVAWVYSVTQNGGAVPLPSAMPRTIARSPATTRLSPSENPPALQQPADPTDATALKQAIYANRQTTPSAPQPSDGRTTPPDLPSPRRFSPPRALPARPTGGSPLPNIQTSPPTPLSDSRSNGGQRGVSPPPQRVRRTATEKSPAATNPATPSRSAGKSPSSRK